MVFSPVFGCFGGSPVTLKCFAALIDLYTRAARGLSEGDESCPPVTTAPDFDLELYTSKRWFVHQQAPTQYLPVETNFCAYADYDVFEEKTFPWGYEVSVFNYAENEEGEEFGGHLCAFADDSNNLAKLKVAPCFLPKYFAGKSVVFKRKLFEEDFFISDRGPHGPKTKKENTSGCLETLTFSSCIFYQNERALLGPCT